MPCVLVSDELVAVVGFFAAMRRRLLIALIAACSGNVAANTGPAFENGAIQNPPPSFGASSRASSRRQGQNNDNSLAKGPFVRQVERLMPLVSAVSAIADSSIEPFTKWQFENAEEIAAAVESRIGRHHRLRWFGDAGESGAPSQLAISSWPLDGNRSGAFVLEGERGRMAFIVPPPANLDHIEWWRARTGVPRGVVLPGPIWENEQNFCLLFWEARAAILALLLLRGIPHQAGLDSYSALASAADMGGALWVMGGNPHMADWLFVLAHRRFISGFFHRQLAWTCGGSAILQAIEDGRRLGTQAQNIDLVYQIVAQRAPRHARRVEDIAAIEAAWRSLERQNNQSDNLAKMGRLLEALDPRIVGEAQRWINAHFFLEQRRGEGPLNLSHRTIYNTRSLLEFALTVAPEGQKPHIRNILRQWQLSGQAQSGGRRTTLPVASSQMLRAMLTHFPPGISRAALLDVLLTN